MGFYRKTQEDSGKDSKGKKWAIAGVYVPSVLEPISTKPRGAERSKSAEEEECCTTPTSKETMLPEKIGCPAAPRKRRPSLRCNCDGVRDFFSSPDLESTLSIMLRQLTD